MLDNIYYTVYCIVEAKYDACTEAWLGLRDKYIVCSFIITYRAYMSYWESLTLETPPMFDRGVHFKSS